jgi:L-serine deaminase
MSEQGISKDVLNAVKKATGKSKMVNIPVSNETADEIIKAVKNTGNIGQLENLMKTMMKK